MVPRESPQTTMAPCAPSLTRTGLNCPRGEVHTGLPCTNQARAGEVIMTAINEAHAMTAPRPPKVFIGRLPLLALCDPLVCRFYALGHGHSKWRSSSSSGEASLGCILAARNADRGARGTIGQRFLRRCRARRLQLLEVGLGTAVGGL